MVWSDNGKPSMLSLTRKLGGDAAIGQLKLETMSRLPSGTKIRLVDLNDKQSEWFCGHVGQEQMLLQTGVEQYAVTAYGPELRLGAKVVEGQWFANSAADDTILTKTADWDTLVRVPASDDGEGVYQTHLPAVFNRGGLPNMSPSTWILGTSGLLPFPACCGGGVFCDSDRRAVYNSNTVAAQYWTAYKAFRSLVEWVDNYAVVSTKTDWKAIEIALYGLMIGEVDVDGKPLAEALRDILEPLGFAYSLDPMTDGHGRHVLRVYPLIGGAKTGLMPYLPPEGTEATSRNGVRAEVGRLEVLRDAHNVRNSIKVLGARIRVQVELSYKRCTTELFEAWDTSAHDLATYITGGKFKATSLTASQAATLHDNYHSAGSSFDDNRDVWRTFVFNEDGAAYDSATRGQIPTLSDYWLGDARIRRPIGPMLVKREGSADWRPPRIRLTVAGHTIDFSEHCEVLKDRAGLRVKTDFWKMSDKGAIELWRPFADVDGVSTEVGELSWLTILNDTIEDSTYRMILSVVGTLEDDKCVEGERTKAAGSLLPWNARRVIRAGGFRWDRAAKPVGLTTVTADDRAYAIAMAGAIRDASDAEMGHASVMLHILSRAYPPGTVIPQTSGRAINLRVDGNRKTKSPVVRQVVYTFGETNITELLMDSPLLSMT